MQKISSYLYPNRIQVVADVTLFSTRWNIVYQNRIKIYKGVDNVLTVDVKNSDQKRIDITDMNLELNVMDINGQFLTVVPLINTLTQGLATVTITPDVLENLTAQFLTFTIYRINDDSTKTLMYADTQFGAVGNMELVGSAVSTLPSARYITRWIEINNTLTLPWTKTFYSDAVEVRQPNYLDAETADSVDFEFLFKNLDGIVTVQFTKDTVISSGITWETMDTFTVDILTTSLTRTYSNALGTYNREWAWARVNYVRTTNNTGSIDKVTIRL